MEKRILIQAAGYLLMLFIFLSQTQVCKGTEDTKDPGVLGKQSGLPIKKKCYVWFEANTLPYFEKYMQHSNSWIEIGNPIMTARIDNIEYFTETLVEADVTITGGFKTFDVLKRASFSDFDAWAEIARVARKVSKITNGRPVVLDNEGALKHLLKRGVTEIDFQELHNSISAQEWPEIWFWHAIVGKSNDPIQTMSYEVAMAIMDGIPNVRLIEASSSGYYGSYKNRFSKRNLRRTLSINKNPISIIYLDDDKKNFWKLKDTLKAIRLSAGDTVILYPGFGDIDKGGIVRAFLNNQ